MLKDKRVRNHTCREPFNDSFFCSVGGRLRYDNVSSFKGTIINNNNDIITFSTFISCFRVT